MAWWNKYKGTYRIRADVDERFNDYPRECSYDDGNEKGKYIDNDVYISCSSGRVYNVARGIYEAWIGDIENKVNKTQTFKKAIKQFKKDIIAKSIIHGDGEGSFQFKENLLPQVVTYMGGDYKTCIDRSPFSKKNLEKEKYEIPENDLLRYNNIKSKKDLKISDYNKIYKKVVEEEYGWDDKEYSKQCRIQKLSSKDFIHKNGLWDKLLKVADRW